MNEPVPRPVQAGMKRDVSGIARAMGMRAWRDKKGGQKPAPPAAAPTVLDHWLAKWREAMGDRGVRDSTVTTQMFHVKAFTRWCQDQGVSDPAWISTGLAHSWMSHLASARSRRGAPLSCATVDGAVGSVRRFLGFLAERRAIPSNPLAQRGGRRRAARPLPMVLDEHSVAAVLEAPDTSDPLGVRDRAMLEVLYSTGMRRSELTALRIGDIRLDSQAILVAHGKGDKPRMLPLGPHARLWLNRYLTTVRPLLAGDNGASEALFLTGYGEGFSTGAIGAVVRRHLDAAGLQCHGGCHLMRHACATHMLDHGADLRVIQELLGHSRLDTTAIYTHVSNQRMCKAHAECHPRGSLAGPRDAPPPARLVRFGSG